MSGYETLEYRKADGVAFVTINRPEVLNALNSTVFRELKLIFDEMSQDEEVKAVILTGKGDRAFAAGADIRELQKCSFLEARRFALRTKVTQQTIASFTKPVIAALNGFTLGGGLEVAMCCDIRIAAPHAKFGQPEINLGFIPGGGGTQRLARLIGPARAKELVFSGQMIDASRANEIGLVNKVVPTADLMAEAEQLARAIAGKSSAILELAKVAIDRGLEMDLDSGLQMEIELWGECYATEDRDEGIAAFLEKREPQFKGK
ncbi:MAG: crotonase [Firmicutes bacterium]|nr:crotonase [Bacillota bacterium]